MCSSERLRRCLAATEDHALNCAQLFCYFVAVSQACPVCGEHDLHHSRFKSWVERLRFGVTGLVPYRCHKCHWRGWREDLGRPVDSLREVHKQLTDDELEDLDPDSGQAPRRRVSRR